jgi:hypothetical protein
MVNHVELVGLLNSEVEDVEGLEHAAVRFRLKVARPDKGSDTINCRIEKPQLIKRATRLKLDDRIEVIGQVRSRFFRVGPNTASVTEILVLSLRKK